MGGRPRGGGPCRKTRGRGATARKKGKGKRVIFKRQFEGLAGLARRRHQDRSKGCFPAHTFAPFRAGPREHHPIGKSIAKTTAGRHETQRWPIGRPHWLRKDLLLETESEVTSEDVQTPNAKGRGRRERRAIETSSTKNVVRRRRRARHAAESLPAAGTSPPVPNVVTGTAASAIWYGISPFGTASARLVLAQFVWYGIRLFGIKISYCPRPVTHVYPCNGRTLACEKSVVSYCTKIIYNTSTNKIRQHCCKKQKMIATF